MAVNGIFRLLTETGYGLGQEWRERYRNWLRLLTPGLPGDGSNKSAKARVGTFAGEDLSSPQFAVLSSLSRQVGHTSFEDIYDVRTVSGAYALEAGETLSLLRN